MMRVLDENINNNLTKRNESTRSSTIYLDFDTKKQHKRKSSFLPQELEVLPSGIQINWEKGVSKLQITSYGASFRPSLAGDQKPITRFVTGSKYLGNWNKLGISGKGFYKYPHGVIYDGHFNNNGEFHGSGILIYPNGQRIEGMWRNGKLLEGASMVTKENNMYNDDYCRMPDRRFQIEIQSGLQPAGQENLTNSLKPIEIPDGCYDAGVGFFDPKLKVLRSYNDTNVFKPIDQVNVFMDEEREKDYKMLLRHSPSEENILSHLTRLRISGKFDIESVPAASREDWIIKNCRRAWSEPTGYKPEFYEVWNTGSRKYDSQISDTEFSRDKSIYYNESYGSEFSGFNKVLPELETSFGEERRTNGTASSLQALSTMFINPINYRNRRTTKLWLRCSSKTPKQSITKKLKNLKGYDVPKSVS